MNTKDKERMHEVGALMSQARDLIATGKLSHERVLKLFARSHACVSHFDDVDACYVVAVTNLKHEINRAKGETT